MVGRVAVWRSPCVQPSDIEVWEAVQWPGDLKAVPTNCIICSVRGKGITALAGGDSDGDDVAVTLNQDLVEFVEHAEAAVAQLDWEQACKPKKELEVEARKLFSTTADRSPTYLQHMLNVPTPNVRGQATALAEKCQQAVIWKLPESRRHETSHVHAASWLSLPCGIRLPEKVFRENGAGSNPTGDASCRSCSNHAQVDLGRRMALGVSRLAKGNSETPGNGEAGNAT